MKKTIILSFFIALITSCNNNSAENPSSSKKNEKATEDPKAQMGLELAAKSDCFTCHKVDQQFTGPAYTAVAAKYPQNGKVIDSLAKKIIKGGVGNWGTVPMTAHPALPDEDAKLMVYYILSLKQ